MAIATVTIGDIVESVSFHLTNNRTPSTDLGAEIKKAIGRVLNAMVLETNHPAFIKEGSVSLVASTSDYDLPDDFIQMIEPGVYYTTEETLYEMSQQDYHRLELQRHATERKPYHYTVRNRDSTDGLWQLRFFPDPDAAYTVNFSYFSSPEFVDDNTSDLTNLDVRFPRQFYQGLVYGAAMEFPSYLGSDQRQDYEKLYVKAVRGMQNSKKPIVGDHLQQRKYLPRGKRPDAAWHSTIYSGSPLR